MADKDTEAAVVGGVDTHKDLHVAAVVDQNNKVLGTQYFSTQSLQARGHRLSPAPVRLIAARSPRGSAVSISMTSRPQ